jgi:hypothetical protein
MEQVSRTYYDVGTRNPCQDEQMGGTGMMLDVGPWILYEQVLLGQ